MSEVFDPEKVERYDYDQQGLYRVSDKAPAVTGPLVDASDYERLLALYREIVPAVPCYVCGREAKGTKAKVRGTGEPVCVACYDSALDSN